HEFLKHPSVTLPSRRNNGIFAEARRWRNPLVPSFARGRVKVGETTTLSTPILSDGGEGNKSCH
ncbi:MAG TPA: hypothetical protein VGL71_06610, partial [Urbifossiella sp.]